MERQLWQNERTADVYVVELEEDKVISAAGPLPFNEYETALAGQFESDPDLVSKFNSEWGVEFRVKQESQ